MRVWVLMGGRAAVGAKGLGQGPADLGPSGPLQLPFRAMLLEGEVGTETRHHHFLPQTQAVTASQGWIFPGGLAPELRKRKPMDQTLTQ